MNESAIVPPSSGDSSSLYLLIEDVPSGPFTRQEIAEQVASGLSESTLCAQNGAARWMRVSQLLAAYGTPEPEPTVKEPGLPIDVILILGWITSFFLVGVVAAEGNSRIVFAIGALILATAGISGGLSWKLAKEKGYDARAWFWLGILLGPFALLTAVGLPKK